MHQVPKLIGKNKFRMSSVLQKINDFVLNTTNYATYYVSVVLILTHTQFNRIPN